VVSVASHLIGREVREMVKAYGQGDVADALDIHLHYLELMRELFMTTNPIPVKAALARLGLLDDVYRLPLTPLSGPLAARLDAVLMEYELLPRRDDD
jgi:4-hydroxy-tetrahydrodipicolinate synthase